MSLADELAEFAAEPGRKPYCRIAELCTELDFDAAVALRRLADGDKPATAVAAFLRGKGVPMKDRQLQAHRRRGCGCDE